MKNKRIDRDILVLLISTLITIVVWVGVETYRAFVRTDLPEGVEKHIKEFDTSIDLSVFDKLKTKNQ
jgi:hypothetical protein